MPVKIISVLSVIVAWYIITCRGDPVEGSRLLEEAFRDYDKRIRPNFGGSSVQVNVSLHILSLPEIDTAKKTFTLSFYLRQSWIDNRFFFNSRRNIDTLMLDADTSERIWAPDTFFVNELSSIDHAIPVKNHFCRISQNGTVLLSKKITLTAKADMELSKFPYDYHVLQLDLESYGSQTKDLKYQWSPDPISSGSLDTPPFTIEGISSEDTLLTLSTGSYSRLSVKIKARRDPLPYELCVMLPLFTLTVLCVSTLFVKNQKLSVLGALFLISVISLINVVFFVSSPGALFANATAPSILLVYSLISTGFGFACFIVNLLGERKADALRKNGTEIKESKSGTESTSEEFPLQNISHGNASDATNENLAQKKRSLCNLCISKCRWHERLQGCGGHCLMVALVATNFLFFLFARTTIGM